MAVQFLHERTGQEGTYRLYRVSPLSGAVGGSPQKRAPFQPGSPAARALAEVQAAGYGMGFAVDVGNNNGDVYVMAAPGQPNLNPPPNVDRSRRPTIGTPTQPTTQPSYGYRPTLPPPPGAQQPGTVISDAGGIQAIWNALKGAIGLLSNVKPWAKMPANSSPRIVFAAAEREESKLLAVGGLLQGIPGIEGVTWMGRHQDGNWFIPLVTSVPFIGGILPGGGFPDVEITPQAAGYLVDPNRVYPEGHAPAGPGGGEGWVPRSASGEIEYGAVGKLIGVPPTMPNEVIVRRCPKGQRLAIDGGCYPKKMLTNATRANTSKKAPVSWQRAQYIREGRKAERAIQKYAETHDIPLEHEHRHEHRRRHTHRHEHE